MDAVSGWMSMLISMKKGSKCSNYSGQIIGTDISLLRGFAAPNIYEQSQNNHLIF